MVAKSSRPDGPFTVCNWSKTDPQKVESFGFHLATFVDKETAGSVPAWKIPNPRQPTGICGITEVSIRRFPQIELAQNVIQDVDLLVRI